MPDAKTIAENKARSEARKIIMALRLRGMKNVEIAHAIGVEPSRIQGIVKGDTVGDALAVPLRNVATAYGAPVAAGPAPSHAASGSASGASGVADAASAAAPPTPPVGETPTLQIEAPAVEADPQRNLFASIKDAALGKAPLFTAPAAAKPSGKGPSFAEQITPIAALIVVLAADMAIPDPYKPVAPTQQEAADILALPVKWICTELDAAGRLSDRSLEVLALLVAIAAYGKRAHGTWRAIHANKPRTTVDDRPGAGAARTAERRESPRADAGGQAYGAVTAEANGHAGTGNPAHAELFAQYMRSTAEEPRW